MTPKEVVKKTASKLNLPYEYVWNVYKAYWEGLRIYISSLPIKSTSTKEEYEKIKTSVNVPSLGKFYADWDRIISRREKYERYKYKEI